MPKSSRTEPRKTARQSRAQVTVDAILEAATVLFAHGDLDSVTTNQIARRAGVSVGSLYQYFPSKQAILGELIDRHAQATIARLGERLPDFLHLPIESAMRSIVEILLEADTIDLNLHRVFLDKLPEAGRHEKRQQEIRSMTRAVRDLLELRRDEVRPADLDVASFILVHALEAVTNAAVLELPDRLRDPTLVDEIIALALRYLQRRVDG